MVGITPPIEPLWVFRSIVWALFCLSLLLMAISLRPKPTYLPRDKRHSADFHQPLVTYEENLRHFGTNGPPIQRQVIPIPHTHYSVAPESRSHQPVRREAVAENPKRTAGRRKASPKAPPPRARRDAKLPSIPSLDRLAEGLKVDDTPSRISRDLIPLDMRSSAPPNSRQAAPPPAGDDDEITDTIHLNDEFTDWDKWGFSGKRGR